MIDVIIPVYNAFDDVVRCVTSVRRHTGADCRIVLMDDASPDVRIRSLFDDLQREGDPRMVFLANAANSGFVGAVNRGMSLSRNDVVLLNSDTITTSRWLEKLRRCADSDRRIGTITPFSNNAEICSFPEFCQNNPLDGVDIEEINRRVEKEIEEAVAFAQRSPDPDLEDALEDIYVGRYIP